MGIMKFIKSQFIEVIEWTDDSTDTMVYRFPVKDNEIKMGAQLTVRESQVAVFVNEGQIADVFKPGRYQLSTENMPVLTKIKSWKYGFNSPFKAEVYFVNTKQFTNEKWGTPNPIMMRDAEFGMIRLRAFGIFSFRVADPVSFLKEVFGTNKNFDKESISGQLKRSLVSGLADLLGETKVAALDLAMYYDELGEQAKQRIQPRFEGFGLELVSLFIENISLPEEVEKKVLKELDRLLKMPQGSAEGSVIRTYLDWIFDLPWNTATEEIIDLNRAEGILEDDHYGLEKVKERIVEYLAIRKVKASLKGPILCLVKLWVQMQMLTFIQIQLPVLRLQPQAGMYGTPLLWII